MKIKATFTIDEELLDTIRKLADREKRNVSQQVCKMLEEQLAANGIPLCIKLPPVTYI